MDRHGSMARSTAPSYPTECTTPKCASLFPPCWSSRDSLRRRGCCTKLVDGERLDENRSMGDGADAKVGCSYQRTYASEIRIARKQHIHRTTRSEARPGLLEETGNVAVVGAGVPSPIGDIAGLAGK